MEVTEDEWRTVWMWIESGAPYAGSYAGLRNAEDQKIEWNTRVARTGRKRQRSSSSGAASAMPSAKGNSETGRAFPFNPNRANNKRGVDRAIGIHERVVLPNDPLTKYSGNILVNLTRPEFSPLILAPLAKEAGGWGSCGDVFASQDDPDYQRILASIEQGKKMADQRARYGTPGFRPNRQYIRELKKYGVLPADFDPDNLAHRHLRRRSGLLAHLLAGRPRGLSQ